MFDLTLGRELLGPRRGASIRVIFQGRIVTTETTGTCFGSQQESQSKTPTLLRVVIGIASAGP